MSILKSSRRSAAITLCVAAMSLGLATAAQASAAGPPATRRPAPAVLSGGLRAVRVPRSRNAVNDPDFSSPWEYDESVLLENIKVGTYAVTINTSNNHLHMWDYYGNTTQIWDVYQYAGGGEYLFVSEYDGLCINVPKVSTSSGVQLIVYSCSGGTIAGVPKNEVFDGSVGSASPSGTVFTLEYDYDLAIDIGNNFPGNGAWVITYGTNYSNYEENWAFEPGVA
jgi:hypothetical protein